MDTASLEAAFRKAFGVFWGKGTIEDFYAFFDDAGFMIDEDTPFVLTKALFKEHVDFHLAGMWTQLEWIPREPKFEVIDSTPSMPLIRSSIICVMRLSTTFAAAPR